MQVSTKAYLAEYLAAGGADLPKLIAKFDFTEQAGALDYLTKASAVYSSNIEGNTIDLNSFMNYDLNKSKFREGKEIEEIEDLIAAYAFAQSAPLTEANLLHAHKLFSATLLIKSKRGSYRQEPVGVFGKTGLAYMAIEPRFVAEQMRKLFEELADLAKAALTEAEVFYHASLIHLRFAHIHPFIGGNGRAARLLEKWFVAHKLGGNFWKLLSEKYYKEHQQAYYQHLNLGVNFYELDYSKCVPFLLMLPKSLTI